MQKKTIKNKVFPFFLKEEQNLVSFKKNKKRVVFKKTKNPVGLFFFWKKKVFSQPW